MKYVGYAIGRTTRFKPIIMIFVAVQIQNHFEKRDEGSTLAISLQKSETILHESHFDCDGYAVRPGRRNVRLAANQTSVCLEEVVVDRVVDACIGLPVQRPARSFG